MQEYLVSDTLVCRTDLQAMYSSGQFSRGLCNDSFGFVVENYANPTSDIPILLICYLHIHFYVLLGNLL